MTTIAFDVGGVLSKFPDVFRPIINALVCQVQVVYISDMHPPQKIVDMLNMNGFPCDLSMVHSADFNTHGELCKAVLCEQLGVDVLIDDFAGYVGDGRHVRLLVMPDPHEPYYHDSWKTDGSEGDFGRRKSSHRVPPSARPVFDYDVKSKVEG